MASNEPVSNDAFIWAVKNGSLDEVKVALERKKDLVSEKVGGRFAIHYAADYGQSEVVELLVAHGANVNAEDNYGITPLLTAIYEGHTETVKSLLAKGADKHKKSPDGQSMVDCAESVEIKGILQQ